MKKTKPTRRQGKPAAALRFDVLTIFPEAFTSYLRESLLKRAQESGLIRVDLHNIRDFTDDPHRKVDDRPFGGGPGMVLRVQPIYDAVGFLKKQTSGAGKHGKTRTILFSTRGKKLDAAAAKRLLKYDRLVLICGRYEGVDERVASHIADEEISIGDYVLSGGELAAMVLIETVSRFIPGFLGKYGSLEDVKGYHPAYTRPEKFYPKGNIRKNAAHSRGGKPWTVPPVLLSGDHAKIEAWRRNKKLL